MINSKFNVNNHCLCCVHSSGGNSDLSTPKSVLQSIFRKKAEVDIPNIDIEKSVLERKIALDTTISPRESASAVSSRYSSQVVPIVDFPEAVKF